MQESRIISAFLFIVVATFLSYPLKVAYGETASQVPTPDEFDPHTIGWIDTSIPKTGGGMLLVSVYYPSIITGEGADPNTTDAPYPTLLFSPGFQSTIDNYRIFAFRIASWGFVSAIVGSEPGSWDIQRATDLNDTLNWLDEQNDNSSFKLGQMIDESKFGVSGHSLGGEAALIVSLSDSRLKVVVPIAPFIVPSMTVISPESATAINIPVLILAGSADIISPPSTTAYPFYENGNPPKFCVTIIGSDHILVTFTCPKYVISFLKFYLYEDQEYAKYLYGWAAQQEVLDGKINLKYDLRKTVKYEVLFKGVSYNVSVFSDSTFLNLFFNETLNEINFTLTGPPDTYGTANISIPNQIIGGYDIEVYFDEELYPFVLSNNSLSYSVYLGYNHSQHQLALNFFDLTPPVLYIISPNPDSILKSPNVTVAWGSEDAASGVDYFEVKVDEETWIKVENAMAYEVRGLSNGDHVAYVKASDNAENSREVSIHFKVDTTAPSVSILSPTACSVVSSPNVAIVWSGSDTVSGIEFYEVKLDNTSWIGLSANASSYNFVELVDGNHTVRVKAVDKAGNLFETLVNFHVATKSNPTPLWVQWWFWAIVSTAILFSAFAIYHVRKRKVTSALPPSGFCICPF